MSVDRVIVAGIGVVNPRESVDGKRVEVMRADSCDDVERLLARNRTVRLVCTDVELPDGGWFDVLRLVVNLRMAAELRVIGRSGAPALRLQVRPHQCSMAALGSALLNGSATA